jgi:hypothetical protein
MAAIRGEGMSEVSRDFSISRKNRGSRVSGPDKSKGGDPGRIRTCDLQLRRLLLYPLSYGAIGGVDFI